MMDVMKFVMEFVVTLTVIAIGLMFVGTILARFMMLLKIGYKLPSAILITILVAVPTFIEIIGDVLLFIATVSQKAAFLMGGSSGEEYTKMTVDKYKEMKDNK